MQLFHRPDDRSFTTHVARARFLWLLVAALALPLAASLSGGVEHSDRFQSFLDGSVLVENR